MDRAYSLEDYQMIAGFIDLRLNLVISNQKSLMVQTRQLAAIMFTDIAGYTELMGDDENKAIEIIELNRRIHKPIIEKNNGRFIKEMGDGIIAIFNTSFDATQAAIEIQGACNDFGRFQLRIGIHLGEILVEKGDIFGDAVNITSRVQTLAVPGSILVSQKVQGELKNKNEFKLESLGLFEFQHVGKAMEVFAVINDGLPMPSRAKLKGKLKEKNARLNKIFAGLVLVFFVVAAMFIYKNYLSGGNTGTSNGSMTKSQEAYAWFTKAQFRLSPENKDDIDSCILFLQKAIKSDSSFALAHAELSRAYSIKNYWVEPNREYSELAFVEAEKALYLNPNLAEAYFAKAYCTWTFENKFPHAKVIREYKKAIALNPDLDEAHHQLSVVYLHVGLMDESMEAYKNAMQLNPDSKFIVVDYANSFSFLQSKTGWQQVDELFNKTPGHLVTPFRAALWSMSLLKLGRKEEAREMLTSRLKTDSTDLFLQSSYAIYSANEGDRAEAYKRIEFCEQRAMNTGHYHHVVSNLAIAYALLGDKEKAVNNLNWVAANGFPSYTYFRDETYLNSLHGYKAFDDFIEKLKITWNEMKIIAAEK